MIIQLCSEYNNTNDSLLIVQTLNSPLLVHKGLSKQNVNLQRTFALTTSYVKYLLAIHLSSGLAPWSLSQVLVIDNWVYAVCFCI